MAAQQASSDLTVMLFSSGYQVMEHANPSLIPMIFQRVRPNGGTMLAPPLDDALNRYFNARQVNPNTKPLIIAIITDGLPTTDRLRSELSTPRMPPEETEKLVSRSC
jgi:hypothetical protein